MKKIGLLAISLLLLTGCLRTSGYMLTRDPKPEIKAKPDMATLVIIRDTAYGGPIEFWHYLDGKLIGTTTGRTCFVTHVKPGPHYVLVTTENTAVAQLDFQKGKTYYLRVGVIMGMWRARTNGYEPLTRDVAKEYMTWCTYTELDASKAPWDMDPGEYKYAIEGYHDEVKKNPAGFKNILEYKGY